MSSERNTIIHNRANALETTKDSYIASKQHELWSTNGLKLDRSFHSASVNSAFLVMMYKIVHNLVDLDRDALITLSTNSTRNSHFKIHKPTSISSARSKFFCVRSINVWNCLSEDIRASPSVSSFKNRISSFNFSSFLVVFKNWYYCNMLTY